MWLPSIPSYYSTSVSFYNPAARYTFGRFCATETIWLLFSIFPQPTHQACAVRFIKLQAYTKFCIALLQIVNLRNETMLHAIILLDVLCGFYRDGHVYFVCTKAGRKALDHIVWTCTKNGSLCNVLVFTSFLSTHRHSPSWKPKKNKNTF